MKRFLLPLLAALALPTAVNAEVHNKNLTSESKLIARVSCENIDVSVAAYKRHLMRLGFSSWLEGKNSKAINTFTKVLVCWESVNTNLETSEIATWRGVAKQEQGKTNSACSDWVKALSLKGAKSVAPYYWISFKKEYKKLIRNQNHEDAYNKAMRIVKFNNQKEKEYLRETCPKYFY